MCRCVCVGCVTFSRLVLLSVSALTTSWTPLEEICVVCVFPCACFFSCRCTCRQICIYSEHIHVCVTALLTAVLLSVLRCVYVWHFIIASLLAQSPPARSGCIAICNTCHEQTLALDYGPGWNGFLISLSWFTPACGETHAAVGESNWLDGTQFPGPSLLRQPEWIRPSEGWA